MSTQPRAIPKDEIVWICLCLRSGEERFCITSKRDSRAWYFLYEKVGGSWRRLGRAKTPLELEGKFDVDRRLSEGEKP